MKRFLILLFAFSFVLLSVGCGNEKNADTEKEKEEKAAEETAGAVEPDQSYQEIEFERINWILGAPGTESTGGIWLYTKEKHPADLDDQDWDHKDMLYIQASRNDYEHKDFFIKKIQVISDDVIKIIVGWEKDIGREAPPRDWAQVETGLLQGKKFIVEDSAGEKVKLK